VALSIPVRLVVVVGIHLPLEDNLELLAGIQVQLAGIQVLLAGIQLLLVLVDSLVPLAPEDKQTLQVDKHLPLEDSLQMEQDKRQVQEGSLE